MSTEPDSESAAYDTDTQTAFDPYQVSEDAPEVSPTPDVQESIPDPVEPSEAPEEPLPEFDLRYRDDFVGLLYLGKLTETFTLWGHAFSIRTANTDEMAKIALLVKPYADTKIEDAVFESAVCAAAVVSVDGTPLPRSIEISDKDDLEFRFNYVMKNWMPPVREEIFNKCFALDVQSREVLSALGKASG